MNKFHLQFLVMSHINVMPYSRGIRFAYLPRMLNEIFACNYLKDIQNIQHAPMHPP